MFWKIYSWQVSLPQHGSWCPHRWRRPSEYQNVLITRAHARTHVDAPMKMWWRNERLLNKIIIKMTRDLTRVGKHCCLELGITCLYFLSFLRRILCDPIGRHVAPWRIQLFDCSVTSLVSKLYLACQVSQSRTRIIFQRVVFDAPYLGQFLSDFVRVKSKVSPRRSTLTYSLELFDRTTSLFLHIWASAI